ncbi:retrovirus-related pol polyprotein from transposon TNT 1-94 [Tanacetum coccineum]
MTTVKVVVENDGFIEVKRKKNKSKQPRQVDGIQITKPSLNLHYKRVEKGESSKFQQPANTKKIYVPVGEKVTNETSSSDETNSYPKVVPPKRPEGVVLKNSFASLLDKDALEWGNEEAWNNAKRVLEFWSGLIRRGNGGGQGFLMISVAFMDYSGNEVLPKTNWTSNGALCSKGTRIILGWNANNVDVNIIAQDDQVMHARLWLKVDKKELFCSFIYAHIRYIQWRALWEKLGMHKVYVRNRPWCMLGDFNAALNLEDMSLGIKPKGSDGVLKKIDRVMANLEFNDVFAGSYAVFQPYRISDHAPCDVVKEGWLLQVSGFCMFRVVKKLKNLKKPLRKLLFAQGNLNEYVKSLRLELDRVQKDLDADPTNVILREEEAAYVQAFNNALLMQERLLMQKAKIEWLKVGDSNSAYFHKSVKSRISRSRINFITNVDGTIFTDDQVASAFVSHYEEFVGSQGPTTPFCSNNLFLHRSSYGYAWGWMEMARSLRLALVDHHRKRKPGSASAIEEGHWQPKERALAYSSSSRNTSSYYVTYPTSVVDYEDEYQQDDIQTNSEDPLASAILNQAIIQGDRVNNQSKNSGNTGRNTRRAYVQEEVVKGPNAQNETGNVQRTLRTSSLGKTSTVQCYNCSGKGHYARNYLKPRVRDSKYFTEQMLLAKQDESGVLLTDEQNDFFFADALRMEEIKELSANICLMSRIQPANNTSDAGPSYDSPFISEVQSSSINENKEQMYPTHTKIINSTIGDDQIDSNIIFDEPNGNVNSGRVEKDTHVPDLYALEKLARNAYKEAEKQQLFAKKVQQQNTTLTSQLELYKERVRVLENINGDNNYLNDFFEADRKAKHFNQQAQSQFVCDRDIIQDLEKQLDKLDLAVNNYKRKNEELQKTRLILKRQMSENEDHYHDTILDLEAKLKKNGTPNTYTLKQAISQCPKLYLASSLSNSKILLNVRDTEDTLDDASKNYKQINALYKDFVPQKELSAEQKYFPSSFIPSDNSKCNFFYPGINAQASIFYTSPEEIQLNDFCQDQVKPIVNELQFYFEFFRKLFQRDIKEMKDVFESTESELCEIKKQNYFLKDQLLEASLKHEVEISVLLNHKCEDNSLHAEIEQVKKNSIEIQEGLQAKIKILEKDVQRCQKQSVDFELKLQHEKEKHKWESTLKNKNTNPLDYSWISKMEKLENENVSLDFKVQSLIKERDNVKLEYQKLFDSIKKTRSQTQKEMDELIAHVSEKTYAYGAIRAENQNLLSTISELKTRLETVEKGETLPKSRRHCVLASLRFGVTAFWRHCVLASLRFGVTEFLLSLRLGVTAFDYKFPLRFVWKNIV